MKDEQWIELIRSSIVKDVEEAVGEIVGFSNYAESYDLAENFLLELCASDEPNIRGISVLGLGHLARVHKKSSAQSIATVKQALTDPDKYIAGHADSAADDISHFTGHTVSA